MATKQDGLQRETYVSMYIMSGKGVDVNDVDFTIDIQLRHGTDLHKFILELTKRIEEGCKSNPNVLDWQMD